MENQAELYLHRLCNNFENVLNDIQINETIYIRSDHSITKLAPNLYEYNDQGLYFRLFDKKNLNKYLNGDSEYIIIREQAFEFIDFEN